MWLLKGPFHTTKLNYHHCKWQILREWTSSDFPCQFLPLCQCMYCHTQVFSHILCINYIWALIPQCGKIQFEIDFDFSSAYFSEQDWIGIKTPVLSQRSQQLTPFSYKHNYLHLEYLYHFHKVKKGLILDKISTLFGKTFILRAAVVIGALKLDSLLKSILTLSPF